MTPRASRNLTPAGTRDRLAAPVVLAYWLLLTGGLALYTAIAPGDVADVAPLWVGCLGGTALGQVLGLRNLRLWLAAVIVVAVPVFVSPFVPATLEGHLWAAFVPAAACGFLTLGDRGGLVAFWFPAMIWMLSILDHVDARAVGERPDASGAILLAGLAVLFVAFLRAREYRRVGLWRGVAAVPLATVRPSVVLREAPGRRLARFGFLALTAALTGALTAWVAPHLWRSETLRDPQLLPGATDLAVAGDGDGVPCCPAAEVDAKQKRVREYLDLGRGLSEAAPRPGVDCRVCAVASAALAWNGYAAGSVDGTVDGTVKLDAPGALAPAGPAAPTGDAALAPGDPRPAPRAVAPPGDHPPPAQVAPPTVPGDPRPAPASPRALPRQARDATPAIFRVVLTLVSAGFLFSILSLALRPIRRLLTLRHLRRPYFHETVDQRVSNLWQLALVGLRDAGWHASTGEPPRAFASRVSVDGMEECAAILERAQHGMGLDQGDLSTMERAASAVYRSARRRLGAIARAASFLRWPLA